jgi:hypothetical protein
MIQLKAEPFQPAGGGVPSMSKIDDRQKQPPPDTPAGEDVEPMDDWPDDPRGTNNPDEQQDAPIQGRGV